MLAPQDTSRDALRRVAAFGEDERYWRINRLEALWCGKGYEGRPSFWDSTVPLRERSPAVQSMLASVAGKRLVHLVFGERSFPSVEVGSRGYRVTLTEDDVAKLGALIGDIATASKLRARMRAFCVEGVKTGTSVAIQSMREGLPSIDIIPAKWCRADRDARGRVTRLIVQYKHPGANGKLHWYRREISATGDRTWQPVECTEKGEPVWATLPLAADVPVPFVAVVWARCLPEAAEEGHSDDGHALAEGLEDEIFALDMALSQLNRNAMYNGEPQMVQVGVDADASSSMGAQGREAKADNGFTWAPVMPSWLRGLGGAPAAKKAPGQVWKLPQGGDAKLLESNGSGAQIIATNISHLYRVVTDALGVVMADPDTMGRGDLSARALSLLFGPMLDMADNLRVEYGDALVEIIQQLLRLCACDEAMRDGVHLASWEDARGVLAKLWGARGTVVDGQPATERVWVGAPLSLTWGEYFEPSFGDISAAVDATTKAVEGRVMSRRRAVQVLAPIVGIDDVDAELDAIADDDAAGREAVDGMLRRVKGEEPPTAETAPQTPATDAAEPVAAGVDPTAVKDPTAALNGAQMSGAMDIVKSVAAKEIPRASGIQLLLTSLPIDAARANAIMAETGLTFFSSGALTPPTLPTQPVAPPVAAPPAE